MYRPPPLRGRRLLADKKVLLIDPCQATREVRAAVLRSHGVEVHVAGGGTYKGRMTSPAEFENSWEGMYQLAAKTQAA